MLIRLIFSYKLSRDDGPRITGARVRGKGERGKRKRREMNVKDRGNVFRHPRSPNEEPSYATSAKRLQVTGLVSRLPRQRKARVFVGRCERTKRIASMSTLSAEVSRGKCAVSPRDSRRTTQGRTVLSRPQHQLRLRIARLARRGSPFFTNLRKNSRVITDSLSLSLSVFPFASLGRAT